MYSPKKVITGDNMFNKNFFAFQLIFALLIAVSFSGCTDDASDSE